MTVMLCAVLLIVTHFNSNFNQSSFTDDFSS